MQNKCVVCGRTFEPYVCYGARQKCCSKECRKEYISKNRINQYYALSPEQKRKYRMHVRERVNGHVKCKICGKPVYRDMYDGEPLPQMHDECIKSDCINTIGQGKALNKAQQSRLYARGWTITEFREEFKDEITAVR